MITRVIQRKRPRPLALLMFGGALVAAGLFAAMALALVNDSDPVGGCDIQVTNKNQTDFCVTTAGAAVRYIGDSNQTFGSSGTGTFTPFVRLQGSPAQAGYNTDGTLQFDSKSGVWTHAIKVSEIPVRTEDGCVNCWELFVDINETNNQKPVSLNAVEIWFTTNANLTGYTAPAGFAAGATKEYDFAGNILINDVNQGSGRGDLRYMVPRTGIAVPPNCQYGNAACATYFVLYSEWGASSGFPSDGGFEEWKVKVYPVLANPTVATIIEPAGPIAIGGSANDSAQLTGQTADAGGTITYKLYSDATCTTLVDDLTPVNNLVVNGVVPDSDPYTFTSAGNFWFWAEYSGDAKNNGPVNSGCASEPFVVSPNTTAPHSTPVVQIKDTLTVTGLTSDATGDVVVQLFPSADCTGTQIGADDTFAASGNVNGTLTAATSFVGAVAGDYSYKITYLGDLNNLGFESCAESVGVTIVSLP